MTQPTFSAWLDAEMRRRRLGVRQLANLVGVSGASVSRWMNGGAIPGSAQCLSIAKALNLDADLVLAVAGHRPDPERVESYHREVTLHEVERLLGSIGVERPVSVLGGSLGSGEQLGDYEGTTELLSELYLEGIADPAIKVAREDNLRERGISAGSYVLIDRERTNPVDGDIVVVMSDGDVKMVEWEPGVELDEGAMIVGVAVRVLQSQELRPRAESEA